MDSNLIAKLRGIRNFGNQILAEVAKDYQSGGKNPGSSLE
jgi:hypothetical protein